MPSEAQKQAGNYAKKHRRVAGLAISIENRKGSLRSGKTPAGMPWSVKLPCDYGYFKRTTGADGDQVDVFVGPNPESEFVVIVNQFGPGGTNFDEHKVMLGFKTLAQAKLAYRASYTGTNVPRAEFKPTTVQRLKEWLRSGRNWSRFLFESVVRSIEFGSALRRNVQIVSKRAGLSTDHHMLLKGQPVGHMRTVGNKVDIVTVKPELQGMGLGKKFYGDVMKRMPNKTLVSDDMVSDKAVNVWESMKRRNKSYRVTQNRDGSYVGKLTGLQSIVKRAVEFRTKPQAEQDRPKSRAAKIAAVVAPLAVAGLYYRHWSNTRPKKAPIPDVRTGTPDVVAAPFPAKAPKYTGGDKFNYGVKPKNDIPGPKKSGRKLVLAAILRNHVQFNLRDYDGTFGTPDGVMTAYRKARRVVPWINRSQEVASQTADIASGQKVERPFYKKAWFKSAVTAAAIGAPVVASRKLAKYQRQANESGIGSLSPLRRKSLRVAQTNFPKLIGAFNAHARIVELDYTADAKGWDLRDARGKSARVFAPGSKRRDRREKTTSEKVSTIRAVRNVAIAGTIAGGLGTFYYRNKLKGMTPKVPLPVAPEAEKIIKHKFAARLLLTNFARRNDPAIHRVIDAAKNQIPSPSMPEVPGQGAVKIVVENKRARSALLRVLGTGAAIGGGYVVGKKYKNPTLGAALGGFGAGALLT